ncbi:MAG: glycosyltransferase family 4 protein [Phycisphaerales bacterium]|nr:MAG: glycosyltransferase family 4 protein [Phycisphaerales bacterium]
MGRNTGSDGGTGPGRRTADSPRDLVIVSNFPRPFRVHIDTRVAREIEDLTVHMFYFRSGRDYLSAVELPQELNAMVLAGPEEEWTPRWWGQPLRDWRKAGPIIRHLRRDDVCAVIFEGYASILILRLLHHCRRRGIPTFIRADSNVKNDRPRTALHAWLKRLLVGWVVRNATGFMPMGSWGQEYFMKYGAKVEQCFWVPSVPDYDLFTNVPEGQVQNVRERFGLSSDRRYLVYPGRFIPVKRLDLLLKAFTRIAGDRPDWDLLMVGEGPLEDRLRALVPPGLTTRVRWLGFLPWEDLRALYHASRVLVLPSDSEAWGVVVMEAMAAGMSVVASDVVAAAHELVRDGVNGRIFAAGNLEQLTCALSDATDAERLQAFRGAVPESLRQWRLKADPVEGVRRALESVDTL